MDLYKESKLASFEELRIEYDIPRTHLFKYLQLRSFVYAQTHSYIQPPLSILENLAVNNCTSKGQISLLYGIHISEEDWREVCSKAQLLTINNHLRMIQYNWIMRTSITPDRLNKMNPNTTA